MVRVPRRDPSRWGVRLAGVSEPRLQTVPLKVQAIAWTHFEPPADVPWETDVTVACGGAAVQPGDVVVGDGDGVLVVPPALVEEVLAEAEAQEAADAWVAQQVAAGAPVDGLFPMNAQWRARYERETGGGAG